MIANLIRHWFFGHHTLRVTRKAVRRLLREKRPTAGRTEQRATIARINELLQATAKTTPAWPTRRVAVMIDRDTVAATAEPFQLF